MNYNTYTKESFIKKRYTIISSVIMFLLILIGGIFWFITAGYISSESFNAKIELHWYLEVIVMIWYIVNFFCVFGILSFLVSFPIFFIELGEFLKYRKGCISTGIIKKRR